MNGNRTQLAVAVLGIGFLGICTVLAVVGQAFFDGPNDLTFALVTALTGVTGASSAYLFRLNGKSGP